MSEEASLIVAPPAPVEKIKLSPEAEQLMEVALSNAALIGKVTNADENAAAANAQAELKRIVSMFDKAGKAIRDPHTKFCKDVIAFVEEKTKDANLELNRISTTIGNFQALELAKQRAAENAARLEQERIRKEQEAAERKLREEAAAAQRKLDEEAAEAARKLREATDAKARAEAEALQREIERQKQLAEAKNLDAMDAIQEKFSEQAAQISTPAPTPVRAEGQRVSVDWEITRINEHQLAKARPDLVRKIEFDVRSIKDELKRGVKLPGVEAREVVNATTTSRGTRAIEV